MLLAFLRDDLVEGLQVISDQQLVDAVDRSGRRHPGALLRWRPNPTWLIAAGATVGPLRGWLS